jgi:hypothetical protein
LNYYQILEVDKNATEQEIKKSYRKLVGKYHPDRNKAANATKQFQLLQEAYETLMDASKRRVYEITLTHEIGRDSFFADQDDTELESVFYSYCSEKTPEFDLHQVFYKAVLQNLSIQLSDFEHTILKIHDTESKRPALAKLIAESPAWDELRVSDLIIESFADLGDCTKDILLNLIALLGDKEHPEFQHPSAGYSIYSLKDEKELWLDDELELFCEIFALIRLKYGEPGTPPPLPEKTAKLVPGKFLTVWWMYHYYKETNNPARVWMHFQNFKLHRVVEFCGILKSA